MQFFGTINKMQTTINNGVAQYKLPIGKDLLDLNEVVGKNINLNYAGKIFCSNCLKPTKKSYSGGHCYLCSIRLASCDLCILRPETCHHHLGTCRDSDWGLDNCFSKHIVYLANSSTLKVGITRKTNVPSRWVDQGAVSAIKVFEVESRRNAGLLEVIIGKFMSDKTNWRKMLKHELESYDLTYEKQNVLAKIKEEKPDFDAVITDDEIINIDYPVHNYPTKITSLSFDKTPTISGALQGIKGQYLILDCGVLNIRKFSSYEISFEIN